MKDIMFPINAFGKQLTNHGELYEYYYKAPLTQVTEFSRQFCEMGINLTELVHFPEKFKIVMTADKTEEVLHIQGEERVKFITLQSVLAFIDRLPKNKPFTLTIEQDIIPSDYRGQGIPYKHFAPVNNGYYVIVKL